MALGNSDRMVDLDLFFRKAITEVLEQTTQQLQREMEIKLKEIVAKQFTNYVTEIFLSETDSCYHVRLKLPFAEFTDKIR